MSNGDATSASTASKFSLSLGSKKTSLPQTSRPQQKRPHASSALKFGGAEDEHEEREVTHQQISGFGKDIDGDSTKSSSKKEQRIIPSIPDRDWQAESKRKRQKHIPGGEPQLNGNTNKSNNTDVDTVGGSVPKYGLNVVDRSQPTPDQDEIQQQPNGAASTDTASPTPPRTQTADEEALDALLGKRQQQQTTIAPPSPPPSDDQVFRDSYDAAPRNCTLEEYEATPVEGYGAAILRGYLKEGQTLESHTAQRVGGNGGKGKPSWIPERRPGLLGLGAKESGLGVELGAWGKGAGRGRGSRQDEALYNPLARRNKKTGEMISEDELKRKVEEQGRVVVGDAVESKGGDRRLDDDEESDRRHRRKERERDRDRDRGYGKDSDREKDRGKHRRYDDEEREGDRRRHDRHREHDSDRSRHTSDRDSDRHRRRDRSRDRRKERDYHSSRRD